jgi:hypothetical protein
LASGTQGKAVHEVEPPPQEGEQELKVPLHKGRRKPEALPPERERERRMTPQGSPNEGELEPSWPPRVSSHEVVLSTWEGLSPWDPGGKPLREYIFESKRPVEATAIAWDNRRPQQEKPDESSQSGNTITKGQPRTLAHAPIVPPCRREVHPFFGFRGPSRGHGAVRADARVLHCNKASPTRPFGGRHTGVTCSHARSRAAHRLWPTTRATQRAAAAQHISCAPPFLCRAFSDSESPRPSNARVTSAVLRSYTTDDEERRYLSAWITPPANLPLQSHLSDSPLPLGCPTCEYPSCVWLLTAG